jgi:hypothetical protein
MLDDATVSQGRPGISWWSSPPNPTFGTHGSARPSILVRSRWAADGVRHLDGTVSVVGEPGPLLGIWLQHETRRTTRLVLRHGELLVAYSDGATDHRGPEGTSERRG